MVKGVGGSVTMRVVEHMALQSLISHNCYYDTFYIVEHTWYKESYVIYTKMIIEYNKITIIMSDQQNKSINQG